MCEDSTIVYNEFSSGLVPPVESHSKVDSSDGISKSQTSKANSSQRKTPATRTVSLDEAKQYIGDRNDDEFWTW